MSRKSDSSCKSKRVPWWFVLLPCSSLCSASSSSSRVMDPSTAINDSSDMVKLPISLSYPATSTVAELTNELTTSPVDDEPSKDDNLCTICLEQLINSNENSPTNGAVFKAQCSHAFHLSCISSNIQHGSLTCPICRAHWTLPSQSIRSATRIQRRRSRPRTVHDQYYHVDTIDQRQRTQNNRSVYQPPPVSFSLVSLEGGSVLSQPPYNYRNCYSRCPGSLDYCTLPRIPGGYTTQGRVIYHEYLD